MILRFPPPNRVPSGDGHFTLLEPPVPEVRQRAQMIQQPRAERDTRAPVPVPLRRAARAVQEEVPEEVEEVLRTHRFEER